MSLRTYLFTLIGTLILTLCMSQLFLLYWLEQDIATDVEIKARHLSEQVIELAFHELPNGIEHAKNDKDKDQSIEGPTTTIEIIKTNGEHKVIKRFSGKTDNKEELSNPKASHSTTEDYDSALMLDGYIEYEESFDGNNSENSPDKNSENKTKYLAKSFNTEVENLSKDEKVVLKETLKNMVDKIHDKNIQVFAQVGTSSGPIINNQVADNRNVFIESFDLENNTSALIGKMQFLLIISSVIALAFAYWLSVRFNRPLKALNKGFDKLSAGKYSHVVPEEGVEEIHKTITQFNALVKQLEHLKVVEQEHKEIAHLAELGEVSRGLAHSLRNPVHTIGLAIEELSQPDITSATREKLLLTVQQKIQHIDKNISALLTLTSNDFTRNEMVPIKAVIQDIILECKSDHTKEVYFTLDIDMSLKVKGSEAELRNIFHTLIINAYEASKSGDMIRILAEQLPTETIKVIIKDNGNGLTSDIEKNLFQPHISSKPEGAGMGLYIAQRITKLHYHGEISLENVAKEAHSTPGCIATVKLANNA